MSEEHLFGDVEARLMDTLRGLDRYSMNIPFVGGEVHLVKRDELVDEIQMLFWALAHPEDDHEPEAMRSFFGATRREWLLAERKYKKKVCEHGDSWKSCDVDFLLERFDEEVEEVRSASSRQARRSELADVVNVALMLMARLREQKD